MKNCFCKNLRKELNYILLHVLYYKISHFYYLHLLDYVIVMKSKSLVQLLLKN